MTGRYAVAQMFGIAADGIHAELPDESDGGIAQGSLVKADGQPEPSMVVIVAWGEEAAAVLKVLGDAGLLTLGEKVN